MKHNNQNMPKILKKKREGDFIDYMEENLENVDTEYFSKTADELQSEFNEVREIEISCINAEIFCGEF